MTCEKCCAPGRIRTCRGVQSVCSARAFDQRINRSAPCIWVQRVALVCNAHRKRIATDEGRHPWAGTGTGHGDTYGGCRRGEDRAAGRPATSVPTCVGTRGRTFADKLSAEGWLADERRLIDRDEWTPPAVRDAGRLGRGRDGRATTGRGASLSATYGHAPARSTNRNGESRRGFPRPDSGAVDSPGDVRSAWRKGLSDPKAYNLLKMVLNTAVKDELLERNPCTEGIVTSKTRW